MFESVYDVYTSPPANGGLGLPAPSTTIAVNLTATGRATDGFESGGNLTIEPNSGRLAFLAAHEGFHAFVTHVYRPPEPAQADLGFWNEAVAQWGAHRFVQLNTDNYLDPAGNWALGVGAYLRSPSVDVAEFSVPESNRGYGTSMIAEYLDLRPRDAGELSPVLRSRELVRDGASARDAIRTVSTPSTGSAIDTWLDYARHLYLLDYADPATRTAWIDKASLQGDQIAGPRPARTSVVLDAGMPSVSGWEDSVVGELGVRYIELVPSSAGVGDVHVNIAAGPTASLANVAIRVDRFTPDPVNGPTDCPLGTWAGDNGVGVVVDLSQGVAQIDVPVDGTCSYVLLSIVNTGPGAATVSWSATSQPGAILDNGTVQLGVSPLGNLIVPGGTPSAGSGTERVGVRLIATNEEGLAATQELEGWGIAWSGQTSGTSGFASVTAADASTPGLTLESFTTAGSPVTSEANSSVVAGGMIRVEHEFKPNSYSPNTYWVHVQLTNLGAEPMTLTYRRVLGWDVEPTPASEFVTAGSWCSWCGNDVLTTDNPLVGANPVVPATGAPAIAPFTDVGPGNKGITFEHRGLVIEPGGNVWFTLFIGAAPDEATGIAALRAFLPQEYALAESNAGNAPDRDHTVFLFGFTNHQWPT